MQITLFNPYLYCSFLTVKGSIFHYQFLEASHRLTLDFWWWKWNTCEHAKNGKLKWGLNGAINQEIVSWQEEVVAFQILEHNRLMRKWENWWELQGLLFLQRLVIDGFSIPCSHVDFSDNSISSSRMKLTKSQSSSILNPTIFSRECTKNFGFLELMDWSKVCNLCTGSGDSLVFSF